jgi:hypothetical protein
VRALLVFALVGFGAQLVDGALGMAYGVTSTSLLLAAAVNPATASASVHLAEVGTTLAAGASHWRFGNVDWKLVLELGVPGAVGAFAGATVLSSLSTEKAAPYMAGVLDPATVGGDRAEGRGIRSRQRPRVLGPGGMAAASIGPGGAARWPASEIKVVGFPCP